jgi:type IV pilus assembly protein PilC
MATYYEEVEQTRKQMVSALTYPTIILVFAVGVITFILLYVIPQFVSIYEESNAEINGLTLFIIHLSDFLKTNIFMIILLFALAVIAIYLCYKNIKAFRKNIQFALMHMPVIGKLIIYKELTIFTKTFASLLANNVFITDSMDILRRITNNEIYKDIMSDTVKNIVKGEKISSSFKDHWAIPDIAYYMIVTGESTGQLAEMMQKVSGYYSEMHRSIVTNLKAFVEPILISLLAVVVGVIILAVIVPMFGLMSQMET